MPECPQCKTHLTSTEVGEVIDARIGDVEVELRSLVRWTNDELAAQAVEQLNALRRVLALARKNAYTKVKLNDALPSAELPFVADGVKQ